MGRPRELYEWNRSGILCATIRVLKNWLLRNERNTGSAQFHCADRRILRLAKINEQVSA